MCPHTRQAVAAAGSAFHSFLAWCLMSSCDSCLSSKAWALLWVASLQALRSAAWCSQPLRGMSQVHRVLEGVFVELCLAPLPVIAASQFRTEDLFWKIAVLYSHHMASPSELGLHDQDLNTWHAGMVKYLLVGDSVLSGNAQERAEAAELELVQFLEVSAVACPGLTGWEDFKSVDGKLCCLGDTVLTPNSCRQAPKCCWSWTVNRRFQCQGHEQTPGTGLRHPSFNHCHI